MRQPDNDALPDEDEDADDTSVQFTRREDGSIVASTVVRPTDRDYALMDWLAKQSKLLNRAKRRT
ncbi:MAG TPA: hypothetical protein VN688_02105 [Gemmataceae bacterium]|nr:hypothetical protein [Gemmataceae bacterium]